MGREVQLISSGSASLLVLLWGRDGTKSGGNMISSNSPWITVRGVSPSWVDPWGGKVCLVICVIFDSNTIMLEGKSLRVQYPKGPKPCLFPLGRVAAIVQWRPFLVASLTIFTIIIHWFTFKLLTCFVSNLHHWTIKADGLNRKAQLSEP